MIHEIGIIILNLLWKTYFKCILLSDCNNIVVIRPTNKRAQIAGSTNNLVWRSKKMRASVRGKKTSSQSWPCELDKGWSLWKINRSLWPCKDVSNTLLWFSWHNYIVVEYIKSICANSLRFLKDWKRFGKDKWRATLKALHYCCSLHFWDKGIKFLLACNITKVTKQNWH